MLEWLIEINIIDDHNLGNLGTNLTLLYADFRRWFYFDSGGFKLSKDGNRSFEALLQMRKVQINFVLHKYSNETIINLKKNALIAQSPPEYSSIDQKLFASA